MPPLAETSTSHSRPATPDLHETEDDDSRLRIVRTATESLREAAREDARRKVGKRRRHTIKETLRGKRPFFVRSPSKASRPGTAISRPDEEAITADPPRIQRSRTELGAEEQQAKAEKFVGGAGGTEAQEKKADAKAAAETRRRRNVWLNWDLPADECDRHGQPLARWARNKVRTSKYSLLTFLPKNLTEQFRRAANAYFLVLVILQVFPMFGAAAPQIAMLPLLAVLIITALKDATEDWRRHRIDNEVNNSAVTRLGRWRNVNLPEHSSSLMQRILRLGKRPPNPRTTISRGVRRLREKEGDFSVDFLYASTTALTAKPDTTDTASVSATEELETVAYLDTYSQSSHGDGLAPLHSGRPRSNTSSSSVNAPSFRSEGGAQGVVDYSRRASATGVWERTLWKKLEVGDVVLLKENEQVPADMVVLSSSDADGICFVETKNLDGETNLKPRRSLKATMSIQGEEDVEHAKFVVDSEPPHANLYSYNGVLRYPSRGAAKSEEGEKGGAKEAITINELLLRGCALRNTAWVIGIVVFTGADTKIMMNQGDTPSKRSRIEKETNYNVLANFVILVAMCLACAVANGIYLGRSNTSADFYEPGIEISSSPVLDAVITFAACLILFQNIVPISLVITVELVKSIQAFFIYLDIDMYYEPLDHPCVPKTWNISDDLGQIAYIFSDKTGTLTQNVMEFQRCSVGGVSYGEGITESMMGAAKREGRDMSVFDPAQNGATLRIARTTMLDTMSRLFKNHWLQPEQLTLISPQLADDLGDRSSDQRRRLIDFFRALAICHTVLADKTDSSPHVIEYKAESPDEAALASGARDLGFVFLGRTMHTIDLEIMGQLERWTPLRTLEFNSTRKRMSVVARAPDGRIHLISKGADSVIYQRLRADHEQASRERLTKDLEDFANGGLRTLCIGSRLLAEEEFNDWARTYDAACAAVEDREEEIEKACDLVEHDLTLLGATALEDKLQVGVPDAIAQLHLAGIRLWILTGDKLQTAIEIGFAANVLQPSMDVMIISAETLEGTRTQIETGIDKISATRARGDMSQQHAVVIDGETLRHALDAAVKPLFLELTTQCETVVCCRVSPAQKAQTVRLVKEGKNAMTLAIGDGANDVAMIQAAHVGVGIAGLEGAQAAMSADYAIGQFRFLTKLLLVHGRWSYIRVAAMHANFFQKSVLYTFALLLLQPWANFDATYLFDYTLILAYNLIFTSLPVLIMGAFEQDVPASASLAYPSLYKRGIQGLEYTRTIFWVYVLDGIYQALVVYFVPFFVFRYIASNTVQGYDHSMAELGTTVAICAVMAANFNVGLNMRNWTWIAFASVIGSNVVLLAWVVIFSYIPGQKLTNINDAMFSTPALWFLLLLTQIIALGPRYVYKYVRLMYAPTEADLVRERVVLFGESNDVDEEKIVSPPTPTLSRPLPSQQPMATSEVPMADFPPSAVRVPVSTDPNLELASPRSATTTIGGDVVTAPSSPHDSPKSPATPPPPSA